MYITAIKECLGAGGAVEGGGHGGTEQTREFKGKVSDDKI